MEKIEMELEQIRASLTGPGLDRDALVLVQRDAIKIMMEIVINLSQKIAGLEKDCLKCNRSN